MTVPGLIGLVLSAVGVSGLMAFAVTERTHEIGVRLALGAQRVGVLQMLVGRGMLLALVAVSLAANYSPARRASGLDPAAALRHEWH